MPDSCGQTGVKHEFSNLSKLVGTKPQHLRGLQCKEENVTSILVHLRANLSAYLTIL